MFTRRCISIALLFIVAGCAREVAGTAPGLVANAAVAHQEGDAKAPVQIVYFDDYVCDDCAKFSSMAVEPLRTQWLAKNRAHLTVVDLAWHRGSVAGAAAAACADEQGQYWPMHTMLFERQETWKRAVDIPQALLAYAGELKLDTAKFASCAARPTHRQRLDAAEDASRRFAVRGTPAFVVNGKLYYGSQDWSWVEQVLSAVEQGKPAPPPPFKVPTKKVVDSARLKVLEDSMSAASGAATAPADSSRRH